MVDPGRCGDETRYIKVEHHNRIASLYIHVCLVWGLVDLVSFARRGLEVGEAERKLIDGKIKD